MMGHAEDLLFAGADSNAQHLDEKLFFDLFHPPTKSSAAKPKPRPTAGRPRK